MQIAKGYEYSIPNSKVHGANMGPIWGRQEPGGPHVGPMNFIIWDIASRMQVTFLCKEMFPCIGKCDVKLSIEH